MWVVVHAVVWVKYVGSLSVVREPSRGESCRGGLVGFEFLRRSTCSAVEVGSVELLSVGGVDGMSVVVIMIGPSRAGNCLGRRNSFWTVVYVGHSRAGNCMGRRNSFGTVVRTVWSVER